MSVDSENKSHQETDLFILFNKLIGLIDQTGFLFYRFLRFLNKNRLIIVGLFVAGVVLGFFGDKLRGKAYKNELIITANFGSTNYLYNRIQAMEFEEGPITNITIVPAIDLYAFIKERQHNLDFAKYMSDNSIKFEKYQPNQNIENFHRYHLLTIYSKEKDENGSVINKFFDLFKKEEYFLQRQKLEKVTLNNQIIEYEQSIENINQILSRLGEKEIEESEMSVTTYSDFYQLVNSKKLLIEDLERLKINQLEQPEIIYDISRITNIHAKKIKLIIVLPILFIILFIAWVGFKKSFNRYKLREQGESHHS